MSKLGKIELMQTFITNKCLPKEMQEATKVWRSSVGEMFWLLASM